jgi:hypothetical protein
MMNGFELLGLLGVVAGIVVGWCLGHPYGGVGIAVGCALGALAGLVSGIGLGFLFLLLAHLEMKIRGKVPPGRKRKNEENM